MVQQDLRYRNVRVALFDRNMSMRRLIRSSLNSIGFTSIIECRNVDDLESALRTNELDLLLIDLDDETERTCDLVRAIRNDEIGDNPFIVVVALTWHPEREVINLTLTAGTDDVVTKPVSAKVLRERVKNLVENRRQFVVTESYVGPERRSRPESRPSDLPPIDVPNTLRQRATGEETAGFDDDSIKNTKRQIKIQKVYRIANQVTAKLVQLEERMTSNGGTAVPAHHLQELAEHVRTANDHIVREDLEHLSGIGASMMAVMESILHSDAPSLRQLEVLRLHSQAVVASVEDNDVGAGLVAEALEKATKTLAVDTLATTPRQRNRA